MNRLCILGLAVLAASACNRTQPASTNTTSAPAPAQPAAPPAVGIYVTNETGGDLSVIDAANGTVVATIPLGKRPRGIVASPDRTLLYVALSGSPFFKF
jgi:YVTN family beta-propeller protein